MTIGPLMLDLEGESLTPEEKTLLRHPVVGGVILFARNFSSAEQLAELCREIRRVREPHLLIAVDQEGGRVQRFKADFTRLPPAARFGELYGNDPENARRLCHETGWLMATELRAMGVDFSFAPVLDLDTDNSEVIGNRAFSDVPKVAAELALAWMAGVHEAGMAAVGKHFPGHGGVKADSHLELPIDLRPLQEIRSRDIMPFRRMIDAGVEAIMPAHVQFSAVDQRPAGYSRFWLQTVLRGELGFQGVVFSDDLSMQAADLGEDYGERAKSAVAAGCDMVLACNDRAGALQVLEALSGHNEPASHLRLVRMHGRHAVDPAGVRLAPRWHQIVAQLDEWLNDDPQSLALD